MEVGDFVAVHAGDDEPFAIGQVVEKRGGAIIVSLGGTNYSFDPSRLRKVRQVRTWVDAETGEQILADEPGN